MEIDLGTQVRMRFHVEIGGVLIPAAELIQATTRYCHPLLLNNGNEALPISVSGSSILIRYRQSLLQLSCLHQIENPGRQVSEARIVDLGPPRLLVPPKFVTQWDPSEPELENMRDLVAYEYDADAGSTLAPKFLSLHSDQFTSVPPRDATNIFMYFAIGFPSQRIGYDLSPEGDTLENLRARYIRIELKPDDQAIQLTPNRIYMRSTKSFSEMGLDCDGLSGSPIFCVYRSSEGNCHFGFCGIITNANNSGVIAAYGSQSIKFILDRRHT